MLCSSLFRIPWVYTQKICMNFGVSRSQMIRFKTAYLKLSEIFFVFWKKLQPFPYFHGTDLGVTTLLIQNVLVTLTYLAFFHSASCFASLRFDLMSSIKSFFSFKSANIGICPLWNICISPCIYPSLLINKEQNDYWPSDKDGLFFSMPVLNWDNPTVFSNLFKFLFFYL